MGPQLFYYFLVLNLQNKGLVPEKNPNYLCAMKCQSYSCFRECVLKNVKTSIVSTDNIGLDAEKSRIKGIDDEKFIIPIDLEDHANNEIEGLTPDSFISLFHPHNIRKRSADDDDDEPAPKPKRKPRKSKPKSIDADEDCDDPKSKSKKNKRKLKIDDDDDDDSNLREDLTTTIAPPSTHKPDDDKKTAGRSLDDEHTTAAAVGRSLTVDSTTEKPKDTVLKRGKYDDDDCDD